MAKTISLNEFMGSDTTTQPTGNTISLAQFAGNDTDSPDISILESPIYQAAINRFVASPKDSAQILDDFKKTTGVDLRAEPYNKAWVRDTGILMENNQKDTADQLKLSMASRESSVPTQFAGNLASSTFMQPASGFTRNMERLGKIPTAEEKRLAQEDQSRYEAATAGDMPLPSKESMLGMGMTQEQIDFATQQNEARLAQTRKDTAKSTPISEKPRVAFWTKMSENIENFDKRYVLPEHEPVTMAQKAAAMAGQTTGYMVSNAATAGASSYLVGADQTYQTAKETGKSDSEAAALSMAGGLVYTFIEQLQTNVLKKALPNPIRKALQDKMTASVESKLFESMSKELGTKTIQQTMSVAARKGGKFVIKHSANAISEGLEEAGQFLSTELIGSGGDTSKLDWDKIKSEAMNQFEGGAGMYAVLAPMLGGMKILGNKKALADFETKQAKLEQANIEQAKQAEPTVTPIDPVFSEQVKLSGQSTHPITDPQVSVVLDQAAQLEEAASQEPDMTIRQDLQMKADAARKMVTDVIPQDTVVQIAPKEAGVNDAKDAKVKRAIQGQLFAETKRRYKELGLPDSEQTTVKSYLNSLAEQLTGVRSLKNNAQTADGFQAMLNTLRQNNKHIFVPDVAENPALHDSIASTRQRLIDNGLMTKDQWGELADRVGLFRNDKGSYAPKRVIPKATAYRAMRELVNEERLLTRKKAMSSVYNAPDVAGVKAYDTELALSDKSKANGFSMTDTMRHAMFTAEEQTGQPFGEVHLDAMRERAETHMERRVAAIKLSELVKDGVDIHDREATVRIANAIANKKTDQLSPTDQKLATFFEGVFNMKAKSIQADALWKAIGGENSSLGDKADKYIQIYATDGLEAAQNALFKTRDGLRENYFPIFLDRMITAKGAKGIQETSKSKQRLSAKVSKKVLTPYDATMAYINDVSKSRMARVLGEFDQMVLNAKDKLLEKYPEGSEAYDKAWRKLNAQTNQYKQTMQNITGQDELSWVTRGLDKITSQTIRTAFFLDPTKAFRNRLQNVADGYGLDFATATKMLFDTKLTKADVDFMESNVFLDEGLVDMMGVQKMEGWGAKSIIQKKNALVDLFGTKLNVMADIANRRDSMIMGIGAMREAAIDVQIKYGSNWMLNKSAVKDLFNSGKVAWMDDFNTGMKRNLLRTLASDGFDAMARQAAWYKTQIVHGDYNNAERSFLEQGETKFLKRLTVYPALMARRVGRPLVRLMNPKTPTVKRVRAANDIAQLIIRSAVVGAIFNPLGSYGNPYSLLNILSVPGGIAANFLTDMGDMIQALTGGSFAKAITIADRLSTQLMPTKKLVYRIVDQATGQKNYVTKMMTGKIGSQRPAQRKKDQLIFKDVLDYYVYYSAGPNALKRSQESRKK